jgi:hypothetical protein
MFNDTLEGPRAPAVKSGRVIQEGEVGGGKRGEEGGRGDHPGGP